MSFRRSKAFALAVSAASIVVLAPHVARAGDEEWHAGGRLGVVHVAKTGFEPAVGLHGAYGLSDMFDATVEVLGSHHVGSSGTDLLSATAGIAYKLDVFEWIPYVAALAGYYGYAGAPGPHGEHGSEFGASVQLGVDYLPMRELALGADVRWHASFHDGLNVPIYSATLGAEYRWGW